MSKLLAALTLLLMAGSIHAAPAWMPALAADLERELVATHGPAQAERARRGLRQVMHVWREDDGDAAAFAHFVRRHFAGDDAALDRLFARYERQLEALFGHMQEIQRRLREPVDLDAGPIQPVDELFAAYDPTAHVLDDFFRNRLAFVVLLNFPVTTLDERLRDGPSWSRRAWAETRLAEQFARRIPAAVRQEVARAFAESERYIAEYNIWMHHLVDDQGRRLFPPGMKLLSHWNLRDEIKAQYVHGAGGLPRQRMIQRVMERIVAQEIPAAVINNPGVDWNPHRNTVAPAAVRDADGPVPVRVPAEREADTRYAHLLNHFQAQRRQDPYVPTAPTFMQRRFEEDRQIPEARFRAMLEEILGAPEVAILAARIAQRLGRPLEPFDIWYAGFRARGGRDEAQLDRIVARRYPDAAAYARDMPRMLRALGFPKARAAYLAEHIVVEAARGSGHAMGAAMRGAPARLRTRIGPNGMDYKGYNIAVHEMGHNVEQVLSLDTIDHVLLQGVPNTAFTEALAFVFQKRDMELLGLADDNPQRRALEALDAFWSAYEIAGVALVDMEVWHWMYAHPRATPATLRRATLDIARKIWNRWYAPVFGQRDVTLLAVYSHMIQSGLYLPDYPMGFLIAAQIERHMAQHGRIGPAFERMARLGRLTPDQWMREATGAPVSAAALLASTREALAALPAE